MRGTIPYSYADLRWCHCVSGPLAKNDVCDMGLDPARRAAALVEAMTIQEKLVNLVDHSQGAQRLGLPKYDWWSEALHGVAFSPGVNFSNAGEFSSATSFANPITISAAFDDDLVEKIGLVIGAEARAFGNAGRAGIDFWTPNINPFKDPRWGRGLETPGEDPLRIAKYVKHLLKGMEWASQDPDIVGKRQIIATCKHFAAYDLERWKGVVRYAFNAIVSLQDLVEYYLPPFRQCARDSNVGSIMCSYNRVNGTPACANEYLMQTVLREHWNWTKHNNYVVSDCNAVHNIYADHKWVKTAAQAAGAAFNAGTDNVCEAGGWSTDVIGAYNQSLLSEKVIDNALRRQYEGLIRSDYFARFRDDVVGFRAYGWETVNTETARNLALSSATDGAVLLKDNGLLPYRFKPNQTIAVIGMWANDTRTRMLGNYNGRPPFYRTPLEAAQRRGFNVKFADGPVASGGSYSPMLDAAKAADIVLYFGGIDVSIESEDLDRTSITWPAAQLAFLNDVAKVGKPIVVVQLGTSVDNTPLLENKAINSVLWMGYPGMYGGDAAFDIISGLKAPAGRLPVTQYPGAYADQVPMTDMSLRPSAINPGRTYKWYDGAVQEFGFGLHYTKFSVGFGNTSGGQSSSSQDVQVFQVSQLAECTLPHKDLCKFPSIPISVTNNGNITSDFVALAFVSSEAGPSPHPIKELVGYERLRGVKPNERRNTELDFTWGDFARVDGSGNTIIYAGVYCLALDVPEQSRLCFEIQGEDVVLDEWPQPRAVNTTIVR
ncbi:glycoside hydrolase family 3 protein [Aaosphaeria arxii CBS 175.79]|uniref:xylan 1,4-beta-xylosidase n=1 Tax=Aaosphaeria arxii CBS 175.79 TaxID=1450172 RepID=A0A6A5XSY3_9PLEO|nr:glycoside hydrolase family 3 protein [Aaosphaeria arxii CBS 175.79]KAF2015354.1 glycoside hydrolase family 3 protein [Aaosphaeria arxii CBS 175.79]